MKKTKILATLALTIAISSSPLIGTHKALASSSGNVRSKILSQKAGQASVPILQEIHNNPSYYKNGLPSTIQIEKRDFNSENVILDVKFDTTVYVGNNYILKSRQHMETGDFKGFIKFMGIPIKEGHRDDFVAKFTNVVTKVSLNGVNPQGYIRKDNKVVKYFSEIIDGNAETNLDKAVIPAGETAFSIILKKDSPLINDIKVQRSTFFRKLNSDFITPNQQSRLSYSTTSGVTNEKAFSIAKTVGTSFNFGLGISKGPLSGSFGVTLENSLTKTFSSSYSVSNSETISGTHVFDAKDGLNHRVGIYNYGETYTSKPTFNTTEKNKYPFLYPTANTTMYMTSIQSLDISEPTT